jgi:hypothetical protein
MQTLLEICQIGKGLPLEGLPGHGLMMAFDAGMLQRWPFVDETYFNTQGNQPKMDAAGEWGSARVVIEGTIMRL